MLQGKLEGGARSVEHAHIGIGALRNCMQAPRRTRVCIWYKLRGKIDSQTSTWKPRALFSWSLKMEGGNLGHTRSQ